MSNRESRFSSKFRWYYAMNADTTLKGTVKQILGVLAMKQGNEVDLDGQKVVKIRAISQAQIAELTGHDEKTVRTVLKVADRAGWIEVYQRGDGAGNKCVYVLTWPEKAGDVTRERRATSPGKGGPRDPEKAGVHFAKPQVAASQKVQVLEVPESTESTSTPAARSRVTRAPRAAAEHDQELRNGVSQNERQPSTTNTLEHGEWIGAPDAKPLNHDDEFHLETWREWAAQYNLPVEEPAPNQNRFRAKWRSERQDWRNLQIELRGETKACPRCDTNGLYTDQDGLWWCDHKRRAA